MFVKDQILRFNVSMNDSMAVHRFKCLYQTSTKETGLVHIKFSLPSQMEPQITSEKQIHNQIEIFLVLKGVMSIYYKATIYQTQKFQFVHYWLDTLFVHNSRL